MKAVDVTSSTYIDFNKENHKGDPNLKLLIMQEYLNIKIFLQKANIQIGVKNFLWLEKLKTSRREHVIGDLNSEEIIGTFH